MTKLKLLMGIGLASLLAMPGVMAADYLGGTVKSVDMDGKSVLTDANGMTLYIFDKDTAGVTNCYDQCATNWPPLMAEEGAAPEGEFTLVERTDGTTMWAYKGMPLYLWVKDTKAGDITGDGVGGVWHLAVE